MRWLALSAGILLGLGAAPARAGESAREFTFNIYVYGQLAGTDMIQMEEKADAIIFKSRSQLRYADYAVDLKVKTEVDRETLAPRYYTYEGTRTGQTISGTLWTRGDSVIADLVENGNHFPSGKRITPPTFLFENYVIEHQFVLLRAIARADAPYFRFSLLFPSDFTSASCIATVESEVELDTRPSPTVCRKYQISIQNSSPFFGYFDDVRRMPIYLDFPASNTEIFLKSAFGPSPKTKYTPPRAPESGP